MPGLDDVQKRADEMPSGGDFNKFPTLQLEDGETAILRFIGTGQGDDALTESAAFHRVQAISKRTNGAYTRVIFCAKSFDEDEGVPSNCEFCNGEHGPDAKKLSLQIGLWAWCFHILRKAQPKEGKPYDLVTTATGQQVLVQKVDSPIVWQRGPGKDRAFLNHLKLIRDLQGGLNKLHFNVHRKGAGRDDTTYSMDPDLTSGPFAWSPEQLAVIKGLPTMKELLSGAETYPRTSQENALVTVAGLTQMAPTSSVVPPAAAAVAVAAPETNAIADLASKLQGATVGEPPATRAPSF